MDTKELIERWRERRREILKTLAPELFAEYRKLGGLIKNVLAEQRQQSPKAKPAPENSGRFFDLPRTPLWVHKGKLIEFMKAKGRPVLRSEIINGTDIPSGSLSELLRSKEFKKARHGFWTLKGDK